MKQKGWTVNVVGRLAINSHITRSKFLQYDGNNRGQRKTGKAVNTNSLIKNKGRKYFEEIGKGKNISFLNPERRADLR